MKAGPQGAIYRLPVHAAEGFAETGPGGPACGTSRFWNVIVRASRR